MPAMMPPRRFDQPSENYGHDPGCCDNALQTALGMIGKAQNKKQRDDKNDQRDNFAQENADRRLLRRSK